MYGSQLTLLHSKELASPGSNSSCTWMAFGRNYTNLAQLEKKRTRLRLYTNYLEEKRTFSLTIPFFIMENVNPPPTNNPPVLPTTLRAKVIQELNELHAISTYINSRLENIDQFLNGFTQQPNEIDVDSFEHDNELVDTPLVSPFLDSNDDSDDIEVLNELEEYDNARKLCRQRAINSFDGGDLAFQCMIRFRKFVAYFYPFLPMNIITRKAYTTIRLYLMRRSLEVLRKFHDDSWRRYN
ncbi:hypothetical protein Tco_0907544 [Tanacetum coccineum]|uniref:Uncharacterized protein n=1 Tax=Tanacetum coccineum TaxID=301880 RepID=A0ABQ5CQY6_9ASTR